jgi:hypothetical protein
MSGTEGGSSLGGAVSEHADADASTQVQAVNVLCAAIAVEADASRREELGREGYRRVLELVQGLEQANLGVRSAFEAAADRSATAATAGNGGGQRGAQVIGVWEAARRLEAAVTVGTAVFGAFTTGMTELGSELRPRVSRALNTQHLRELVSQGIASRTAAKKFLSAVLLQAPAPAMPSFLAVRGAGVMGQGLFATAALEPGTIVGEYKGEVLDAAALDARYPGHTDCDYVRADLAVPSHTPPRECCVEA